MDFTENEENTKTDANYMMEIRESVLQLYKAILSVRGKCIRRDFQPKDLLNFTPFPERPMNMSSHKENICRNLAFFQLKINSIVPDGDFLLASILLQLAKNHS